MSDIIERLEEQRKWYCTGPCGQSSAVMDQRSKAEAVFKDAMAEIKNLKQRLRDQARQTSIGWDLLAQQIHNSVLDAIELHGGLRVEIDPQAHPIDQVVETVLAKREAEIEDRTEAARWLYLHYVDKHEAEAIIRDWPWLEQANA